MTHKDYRRIAAAIQQTREYAKDSTMTSNDVLNYLTGYLTSGLQADNPRFDREKFAVAAGAIAEVTHEGDGTRRGAWSPRN